MTNTPFNKACFMISCGYGFMGSSTLQQQAVHLVFGTDEGMAVSYTHLTLPTIA